MPSSEIDGAKAGWMTAGNRRRDTTPLPGFPRKEPFRSPEEIQAYRSGDKVQCLICGRWFQSLSVHLSTHDMSTEEYKGRYRIPLKLGLTGRKMNAAMSKAIKARIEKGEFDEHFVRISGMAQEAGALGHEKRKELAKQGAVGLSSRKTADRALILRYIQMVRSGAVLGDALAKTRLRADIIQTVLKRDPELAAAHDEAWRLGLDLRTQETKRRAAEGRAKGKPIYTKFARVLLTEELAKAMESYRRAHSPPLTQAEAIRLLLHEGLMERGYLKPTSSKD